ncbi:MAG: hypothetical protein R3F65_28405 [bacterium]
MTRWLWVAAVAVVGSAVAAGCTRENPSAGPDAAVAGDAGGGDDAGGGGDLGAGGVDLGGAGGMGGAGGVGGGVDDMGGADGMGDDMGGGVDRGVGGRDDAGVGGAGGVGGEGGMGGAVEPDDFGVGDGAPPDMGAPAARGPAAEGPYAVVVEEAMVELGPRGGLPESIPVTVYRPGVDGVFAAVVFNHGFALPPGEYASYGMRLASHGIITAMPLYDDNPLMARSHLGLAQDTVGVVDWLVEGPLAPRVDAGAIGVAGHSRGGKHAIHAATLDLRIEAVFGIDPVDSIPPFSDPAMSPSVAPELMGGVLVPTAYIGAGLGSMGFTPCAPAGDNYEAFYAATPPPTLLYYMARAGHQNFVDMCAAGSQDLTCTVCQTGGVADEVHAFAVTTLTAFMKLHLEGDMSMRPWVDGEQVEAAAQVELRQRR